MIRQVVFKGLAPWVCKNCGEEAYEPADVDLMQRGKYFNFYLLQSRW
jgi:hypothetical protein